MSALGSMELGLENTFDETDALFGSFNPPRTRDLL